MIVVIENGTFQIDHIRSTIRPRRIGRRLEFSLETISTNDDAWQHLDDPGADGLVVFSEFQSGGRGRFGRTWASPSSASILCSVLLTDQHEAIPGCQLGVIAAVAVREAIMSCTGVAPTIRWPNDLYVAHRKVGGILIESRSRAQGSRAFVIGIGINCHQQPRHWDPSLASCATSLEIEGRGCIDRTSLAVALLEQLDGWLATPPSWDNASLRDRWLAGARPFGCRATLRKAGKVFEGTVIDFDPRTGVTVQLDPEGIRVFDAAETTVLAWEPVSYSQESGPGQ